MSSAQPPRLLAKTEIELSLGPLEYPYLLQERVASSVLHPLSVDKVLEEVTPLSNPWLCGVPFWIKRVNSNGSLYSLWTATEPHMMELLGELLFFIP